MKRILFWRHGQTDWNQAARFQGQTDIPLNEAGRQQARSAARRLAHLDPELILVSDLQRAQQTAQFLADLTGTELSFDPRLRETFAGDWEGLPFAEINQRFVEDSRAWEAGSVDVRAGGGESRLDVAERMTHAVQDALPRIGQDGLLVVTSHGGAIRAGMMALLGVPPGRWGMVSGLSNCHWSVLEHRQDESWQLTEHNAGSLPEISALTEG
ncbi:histidine phosphatase family protein [Psychromicrobium xiongbiense]|uniref:histidine phosphatase family protein n=1 Tax=Psychromicrobium xiongbiense TaxID=3051184 RepID=UPI0025566BB2|nr:histidine phosphatase family protein [Psychromicrobium sp. YIM S02556]